MSQGGNLGGNSPQPPHPHRVSLAILAGGQSKRMGRDKAFLKVGGQPVIERILARVKPLTTDILIGTNSPEKYTQFGVRLVSDVYPNKSALGGIYSVIRAARFPAVLVVACDMPFLNPALLQHLMSLAPTADIIAPLIEASQPETLHTVYSKNCLPAIKAQLQTNRLRIINFFAELSVRYVAHDEIARFDPQFRSFLNMNTPQDWRQAQNLT